ncbi:bifunctional diguanylate cyclase/phosphodiesterase [Evansella tamaricis]|uniref:Bifunctional diguanylate cyclase/phosphodiesterase n=1 Tax=Evansella tamaricis TaxID=2069301 RepID=A0ABS6J9I9_9BACI|nr:bifunctional diguanylate cyclase/phosphodiesterase [Evansella tamaricis]MBU9710245.1 bifunctional diguanylate cyclase/phosphodiesterase [Evansella tamaricis]
MFSFNEEQVDISEIDYLFDLSVALDKSSALVITDAEGRITYTNDKFCEISKYSKGELVGKTHGIIKSGYHPKEFYESMWNELLAGNIWEGDIKNRAKDGTYYWVQTTIVPILNESQKPVKYVAIRNDVTRHKETEEIVEDILYYDELTTLPNKKALLEHLNQLSLSKTAFAILLLDLDDFKIINGTYGHGFGDETLKEVSDRLTGIQLNQETVFRISSDEFIIIVEKVTNYKLFHTINRYLSIFQKPFKIQRKELFIKSTIGVSAFPEHHTNIEKLLQYADIAMYSARKSDSPFMFYHEEMFSSISKRHIVEKSLIKSINNMNSSGFHLYYQPQYNIQSEKIVGMEALIRWDHPDFGSFLPNDFIPIAEETGLIVPLGLWTLEKACHDMKKLQDRFGVNFPISVNLSPQQLFQDDFVDTVKETLWKYTLEPTSLCLEITEGLLMENLTIAEHKIKQLKEFGVKVALDDFGSKYSSLNYLMNLPLDIVKIDKSFIQKLTDSNVQKIVTTMLFLLDHLKLEVIVEGIETEDHLAFLLSNQCTTVQGFLFGRPMPLDHFQKLLKEPETMVNKT